MPNESPPATVRVHPVVERMAAYAWRLIVIAVVVLAGLWLLRQLRIVVFPIVVALFLTRALSPISSWLRRHGWRAGLAAAMAMLLFFAALAGLLAAVVPSFADEVGSIRPTLTEAMDDVEEWLVEDSPIKMSHESVDRLRERVGAEVDRLIRSSDGEIADRATLAAEAGVAAVLALIMTFFMLRDGERFVAWASRAAPARNEHRVQRALHSAWTTLAGYLRGATLLGAVEAVVIGLALWLSGGSLVVPVMIVTFLGAYVPLVGAIVTGILAVLVALVTGGTSAAVIVAIVALVVQQFDNDLLAPVIYGRTLHLHPVVILLSVVAGGALFGITGTLLAVPVVAVGINATREFRGAGPPAPAAATQPDSPAVGQGGP